MSADYLHSFNVEALKLAAQGVTIIASSGDNGVNCAGGLCGSGSPVCGYYPTFPASSPYVTAVGATQVRDLIVSVHIIQAIILGTREQSTRNCLLEFNKWSYYYRRWIFFNLSLAIVAENRCSRISEFDRWLGSCDWVRRIEPPAKKYS